MANTFLLKAINIPNKIKLDEVSKIIKFPVIYRSAYEIIFVVNENSYIILYSFGSCVFFNVKTKTENVIKRKIGCKGYINEIYKVIVDNCKNIEVEHECVYLPELKLDYLRIISLILAESVTLEEFSISTENILGRSLSYSKILQDKGIYSTNKKELIKFIGFSITTRQEILSNLYISDYPDDVWDDIELEKLYFKMKNMFDIESRFKSLNMTLNSIQESIEVMVSLIDNSKSLVLERWILILIFIEILLSITLHFLV